MPPASVAPGAPLERPASRWGTAGVVLLGVWSALLAAGVVLWLYAAFLSRSESTDRGLVQLVGAPFALVAVGLLWWAWRSAGALRQGRREGWTLLLVLGGVAVMQSVLTAQAVLAASRTGGAAGTEASGPPREVAGGLLAAIVLGAASVTVALLARRAWAADAQAGGDKGGAPGDEQH
ncbi:MAG: hypothetical protein ACJ710_09915 [Ornithinibacter sp.]